MATTVGQHQVAVFTTPVNGAAIDADPVRNNDLANRAGHNAHDSDSGVHLQSSTLAARPLAGVAGRKWMTVDASVVRIWYDDGTAWNEIGNFANVDLINQGLIRFYEQTANGTNYVALQSAANVASNVTWTLPNADGTAGQILSTNGSGALGWSTLVDYQSFTTSGTWTKPSNISANAVVRVLIWGGGGGGASYDTSSAYSGAGGGGGGCVEAWFLASALGATESVTIGTGGTGGTGVNSGGNNGGNSDFGGLVTAYGGAGPSTFIATGPGGGAGIAGYLAGSGGGADGTVYGGGAAGNFSNISGSNIGGDSYYGGGGGSNSFATTTGGVSVFGGNGGYGSVGNRDGIAPGGGGAGGNVTDSKPTGNGARGEARVWVFG